MNPKFKKSTLKIGGGILLTIALALAAKEGYKAFTHYMQDEMGKSAAPHGPMNIRITTADSVHV